MAITEIIIDRIRREGPISFHDFMDMALYFPGLGYYTSGNEPIGAKGDYLTCPGDSKLFGKMIARQVEEMWLLVDKDPFTIVEYGAGNGSLCGDILDTLIENKKLYAHLTYIIVEKGKREYVELKARHGEKIKCAENAGTLQPVTGCILSNELLDNFAVHQLVMDDQLMEVYVDYDDGFVELVRPAAPEFQGYLSQLGVALPKGFRAEANLQAIDWLDEVSRLLDRGFAMTIDYGYSTAEMYRQERAEGTVVCYHQHCVNFQPYINVGRQDITTHVNFSALSLWGQQKGLSFTGITTQSNFLLCMGLANESNTRVADADASRALYTILADMGNKMKVMVQHKGIASPTLRGLMRARQRV